MSININHVTNSLSAYNNTRATVASAASADIWATGNQIDWTGTTTATGFAAAPQAGAERVLITAGAAVFTAGANMLIDGVASGNLTCAANDTVIVRAVTTTQFKLSRVKYDGTAQVASASLAAATQAQAEAGTANTVALTPLSANWHPGAAKVWIKTNFNGSIFASHNVTSITDTGAGQVTVTIETDFSGEYVTLTAIDTIGGYTSTVQTQTVGSMTLNTYLGTTLTDVNRLFVACFGDQ